MRRAVLAQASVRTDQRYAWAMTIPTFLADPEDIPAAVAACAQGQALIRAPDLKVDLLDQAAWLAQQVPRMECSAKVAALLLRPDRPDLAADLLERERKRAREVFALPPQQRDASLRAQPLASPVPRGLGRGPRVRVRYGLAETVAAARGVPEQATAARVIVLFEQLAQALNSAKTAGLPDKVLTGIIHGCGLAVPDCVMPMRRDWLGATAVPDTRLRPFLRVMRPSRTTGESVPDTVPLAVFDGIANATDLAQLLSGTAPRARLLDGTAVTLRGPAVWLCLAHWAHARHSLMTEADPDRQAAYQHARRSVLETPARHPRGRD